MSSKKSPWSSIHFTGVAGAGMSVLAQLCLDMGVKVSGSDLNHNHTVDKLIAKGLTFSHGHIESSLPPDTELLVFSSAIRTENPERQKAQKLGIKELRRGLFLAELTKSFDQVISIAGAHGKSTICTMLAWICHYHKIEASWLIGAKPSGEMPAAQFKGQKILITEVDESDGTLAAIHSSLSLIPNIEDDHSWSVGGEDQLQKLFCQFADQSQKILFGQGTLCDNLLSNYPQAEGFSLESSVQVPQAGKHNRFNAFLACQAAQEIGLTKEQIREALAVFPGTERRASTRLKLENTILLEDYAHHPSEVSAFIQALKEQYPKHRHIILFQPHRFERLKKYHRDFARELQKVDQVFVSDTFAAWIPQDEEDPIKELIAHSGEQTEHLPGENWLEMAEKVLAEIDEQAALAPLLPSVFTVMGAGTIQKIIPAISSLIIRRFLEESMPKLTIESDWTWKNITTLGIGGETPVVVEPQSVEELTKLLKLLHHWQIAYLPLGCGSNLVGVDEICDKVIIRLKSGEFESCEISGKKVKVGAGLRLSRLVQNLAKNNLGSGEALIAIPGAIGGSIRMNAGAQGIEIKDYLLEVEGLHPDGSPWKRNACDINWHYRGSDIPEEVLITSATMKFELVDGKKALDKINRTRNFRKVTQPGGRNPGCAFRNPNGDGAGRLIDKYGLKLYGDQGCHVSDKHANFLINEGNAPEQAFAQLMNDIQKQIYQKTGIILQSEVKFSNKRQIKAVQPLHIVVLKGGPSSEREISLESAAAVAQALRDGGHQVSEVDVTDFKLPNLPKCDLVFPVLHGIFGEDGQVQKHLEELKIPYVGCDSKCSSLTIDKYRCNALLREKGIRVPMSELLTQSQKIQPNEQWTLPLIVKPNKQGSTVGLSFIKDWSELNQALETAFAVDDEVIVEEFIKGLESTVGVLKSKALPVVEIIPPGEIFDFDAKYVYSQGKTQYNCPPLKLSQKIQNKMQSTAEDVFRAVGARQISRVDMIYRPEDDQVFVLEVNTMPGFTANSLLPKSAKESDISFVELCCSLAKNCLD